MPPLSFLRLAASSSRPRCLFGTREAAVQRLQVLGRHVAGTNHAVTPGIMDDRDGRSTSRASAGGLSSPHGSRWMGTGAGAVASAAVLMAAASAQEDASAYAEAASKTALKPQEFVPFRLQQVKDMSHNTKIFRFSLDPDTRLGLNVASCLVTKARIGDVGEDGRPKLVIRPYTPITPPDVTGHFDLLVKVYPTGKMSQHLFNMKPGDVLEMKGPIPKLPYQPNMKKSIGMVAGGTGITPMLQVIDAILSNPDDNTQVSLVYANTSPDDILLHDQLMALAAAHANFKVFFTVDRANPSWSGGVGFVTAGMLRKALPRPGDDSLVLVCGPPGMMRHVSGDKAPDKSQGEVDGLLKSLGYTKEQVYKF